MEAPARGRWLPVAAAAACVLGCGLAQPGGLPMSSPAWLPCALGARLAAALLAAAAWACAGGAPRRGRLRAAGSGCLMLAGALLLGTARAPRPAPQPPPDRRPVELLGRVVRAAPGQGWFLVDRLHAPDGRALDRPGRRLLVLPFGEDLPDPGRGLRLQGLLRRDGGRALLEGATWTTGSPPREPGSRPGAGLTGAGAPDGAPPWRERLRARLEAVLPEPDAALAVALLLGDSGAAPPALREDYRDLGLLHLLCVSGMHLWCWAAVAARLLRGRAALLRAPLLAGVVAAAGFAAPVVRAGAALAVRALAARRGWQVAPLRLWAAALWTELLLAPSRPAGLGFVLSYAATFHLLLVLDACRRPALLRVAAVSVAATLGTLPWLLRAAATVQPWAPLLSPLFALLLPPRILLSAAALLPGAGPACGALLGVLRAAEDFAVAPLLALPGAPLACTVLPWAAALAAAALATVALRVLLLGRRRAAAALLGCALLTVTWRAPAPPAVVALPAGHGLAVLVGGGAGTLLFDLGSADLTPDALVTRLLLPELRRRGWPLPRAVVLSHADRDHGNGVPALAAFRAPRLPQAPAGVSLPLESPPPWRATLHGLTPELRGAPNAEGQALEVESPGFRAVLLGDPWGHALLDLRRRLRPGPVDLLLLPHHGRTTEGVAELVEHLRPRRLWIACAEDEAPPVLELLRPADGRVERTGPGVLEARPPGTGDR